MKSQEVEELGEVPPAQEVAQWEKFFIGADQQPHQSMNFGNVIVLTWMSV